jgi:heterodisulfide reductase subunit C2
MTMKIKKQQGKGLRAEIEKISGVDLSVCYQCKKCSVGCPVNKFTQAPPSEIIRRLHLGAGDELLESDLVWMCLSCETCYGRCPMQINIPAVIDALRSLAVQKGSKSPKGNIPLFNKAFLAGVKTFGRSYDLAMIMQYKLGSGSLMQDTEKFPTMLAKGKMALLPPSGADKKAVKQVFDRTPGGKGKVK